MDSGRALLLGLAVWYFAGFRRRWRYDVVVCDVLSGDATPGPVLAREALQSLRDRLWLRERVRRGLLEATVWSVLS